MNKRDLMNRERHIAAEKLWEGRREEILWLYENQVWSQQKIANYFNVSLISIQRAMKKFNIPSRSRVLYGNRNGRYKDGTESRLYRQMIEKDKCSFCGATDNLAVHHKNGNHHDNHLENLQVLCMSCHTREHQRIFREMRKMAKENMGP